MIEVDLAGLLQPLVVPRPLCLGLVCGVVRDGDAVFSTFGESGDQQKLLDENAIFEVGSITKVFTGLLLAEMADRGEVTLEDPLASHLPTGSHAPRQEDREIRLVDLATHTSGLPRLPPNLISSDAFDPADPYAHFDTDQLLAGLADAPLEGRIGEAVKYSNFGFELLAFALEQATQATYSDLVTRRIFQPIGMTDSVVWKEEKQGTRLVPGHGDMGEKVPFWSTPVPGDGGLVSTGRDLARFLQANVDQEHALAGVLDEARRPRVSEGSGSSVGLGWWIGEDKPGVKYRWHNGGSAGYGSFMALEVEKKIGLVLLANSHHVSALDAAAIKILDSLCGVS